jgi:Zn-dependent protease with chaperone function
MGKRILLFLLTNIAIMVTLSIVLSLLGVTGYIRPDGGINHSALLVFAFVWGMGGAFISLLLSRFIAKKSLGVKLVNGQTGPRLAPQHRVSPGATGQSADAGSRLLRLAGGERLCDRPEQEEEPGRGVVGVAEPHAA